MCPSREAKDYAKDKIADNSTGTSATRTGERDGGAKSCASPLANKEKVHQQPTILASDQKHDTHDVVFVAPVGADRIFTFSSATSPSTGLVPFAPTLR
jgi:hypothetical protein